MQEYNFRVRYEVPTAVSIALFFWVVPPFRLVSRYQLFGETYSLHFLSLEMEALCTFSLNIIIV
jgi:hypothetical protein